MVLPKRPGLAEPRNARVGLDASSARAAACWRDSRLPTVDPAPASVLKVLDVYLFDSLEQVREITEAWLETYSTERPHASLGQVPP